MNNQSSVAEIIDSAKNLEPVNFEQLYKALSVLRLQKNGAPVLSETESTLLTKIYTDFEHEKWERLQYLDWKLEFGALNDKEEAELLQLTETYETFSVERLKNLSQLALLRQIHIDDLIIQLGLNK